MKARIRPPLCQRGISLIEVLVSVLLMSFGLLAVSSMQAFAIAAGQTSLYRGIAVGLATEYADLVRANRAAFAAGQYDVTDYLPDAAPVDLAAANAAACAYPNCTISSLAQYDIAQFKHRVRASLPKGSIYMERTLVSGSRSATQADLWILWQEHRVYKSVKETGGTSVNTESAFDNCPDASKTLNPLPRCVYMRVAL